MIRPLALALAFAAAACSAAPTDPGTDVRAAFGLGSDSSREVADAFDESADAAADVDAALGQAQARGTNVLLVMGADWCHDSRGLAWRLEQPEVAPLIADGYELVYVDVGFRDKNLDIARRFGVPVVRGTPTVLIVSPEGELLNADSVESWRTASQREVGEVRDYFARYAGDAS